jgi:hypothetical protein
MFSARPRVSGILGNAEVPARIVAPTNSGQKRERAVRAREPNR